PGLHEVSVPAFSLVVRKDVFEEVAGAVPNSWEELHEGLRMIKEEYPDATPLADGFEAQSMLNYASHAFGTKAGWGFGDGMIDNGASSSTRRPPTSTSRWSSSSAPWSRRACWTASPSPPPTT